MNKQKWNMIRKMMMTSAVVLIAATQAMAAGFKKTPIGIKATVDGITMEVQFYKSDVVRVLKYPKKVKLNRTSLSVIAKPETTAFTAVPIGKDTVKLETADLQLRVNVLNGEIVYLTRDTQMLMIEKANGTRFTPAPQHKPAYDVSQAFMLDPADVVYGLGQQQDGRMIQRNETVKMENWNTRVCLPVIQSAKGFGLFWDNYSMGAYKDTTNEMSMSFTAADYIDYYFMWGKGGEGVIAQLRNLTGQSPMLPLWSYGFFQSRERYKTQQELVAVVDTFRQLHVPLDGIIQDWQYWGKDSLWNAMSFNPATYPDPKGMVDQVHARNAHLMIVAWPDFGPLTPQYKEFESKKMLLGFTSYPSLARPYDPYNPAARDIYWNYLNKGVFTYGNDGWWLDSSEPDHTNIKPSDFEVPTFLGPYRSVKNAFPFMHVGGVYDHQRAVTSDKRVVILTRSAFVGQQRYGTNVWNGDVESSWENLRKQITAGINFSLCGMPYWNTDIGGFFADQFEKKGAKDPEFQSLQARWIQFGTFTPMMRVHGTTFPREIYQFGKPGDEAFDVQLKYIKFRYQLLPYIYSTAWQVTSQSGSFMRPLYFDFPKDLRALVVGTEYLFGKSLLVAPVTDTQLLKTIYLPKGIDWYDYWTNTKIPGGRILQRGVPTDLIPLYVKAGTILPMGPEVEYATEKRWDNLDLKIYPGADGEFVLYEDENDNYNYEKGAYTEIRFSWDDAAKTLTVDDRKGEFNGMLQNRTFNVTLIGSTKAEPVVVKYEGKKTSVNL